MPALTGEALRLYTTVYGQDRYDRFNDQPESGTCHRGYPSRLVRRYLDIEDLPAFVHRPEHDVESVYWTMVYALLRAQPVAAPREDYAPAPSASFWETLLSHQIPSEECCCLGEQRGLILGLLKSQWRRPFSPVMRGVAELLWQISQHVCPEYALWEGDLEPDHLHEAVQRLILQYLVDHRNDPIELDPDHLRPTNRRPAYWSGSVSTGFNY